MCGIAGILKLDGTAPDPDALRRMTDALAHRGPDGAGHWQEGPVALGHRRLAIIDLSTAANQPMWSADGTLAIVFNGEIYNYRELAQELSVRGLPCRTTSDTEVILNLYRLEGTACLGKLRGMFAFAIWDRRAQALFLARDRVGIKPLYYARSAGSFAFASEIKAIAVAGHSALRVDRAALAGFFRFLVVPQPATIFEDVRKLEPGRFIVLTPDGRMREETYWQPPAFGAEGVDEDEAIDELDATLAASVRAHLVADVPVGAFLSGGVDSGGVVSLMREAEPGARIDAFSIGFPGQGEYDEGPYAREVARLKGIEFHGETIDERFLEELPAITWHLDEPFAIGSAWATWYLARHAASRMKVVLTGDGGDELFAGYQGYGNLAYTHGLRPAVLWNGVAAALGSVGADRLLTGIARRTGSEGQRYAEQISQASFHALSLAVSRDVFLASLRAFGDNLVARYYDEAPAADRLARCLYAEYRTRLVDEMLMKVDRMTMAHSLEARVPILDHVVVETAFRLPSSLKRRVRPDGTAESKYALKKVVARRLPESLVYRKKQGFDIPVKRWTEGPFLAAVRERLLGGRLRDARIVNPEGVEALVARASDAGHNYTGTLMALLALESWAEAYERRVGRLAW